VKSAGMITQSFVQRENSVSYTSAWHTLCEMMEICVQL